jgi:hypothetical protein
MLQPITSNQRKIMSNKTKTFKIGEYAVGGIVKITHFTIKKENQAKFKIEFLDWSSKRPLLEFEVYSTSEMFNILEKFSTHYWADKMTSHFK